MKNACLQVKKHPAGKQQKKVKLLCIHMFGGRRRSGRGSSRAPANSEGKSGNNNDASVNERS